MTLKALTRDQVNHIIELARPMGAESSDEKTSVISSVSMEELLAHSAYSRKIIEAIENLSQEAIQELIAVMLIGSGENEPEDLEDAKRYNNHGTAAPSYLAGKRHLAQFLEAGLRKLRA